MVTVLNLWRAPQSLLLKLHTKEYMLAFLLKSNLHIGHLPYVMRSALCRMQFSSCTMAITEKVSYFGIYQTMSYPRCIAFKLPGTQEHSPEHSELTIISIRICTIQCSFGICIVSHVRFINHNLCDNTTIKLVNKPHSQVSCFRRCD